MLKKITWYGAKQDDPLKKAAHCWLASKLGLNWVLMRLPVDFYPHSWVLHFIFTLLSTYWSRVCFFNSGIQDKIWRRLCQQSLHYELNGAIIKNGKELTIMVPGGYSNLKAKTAIDLYFTRVTKFWQLDSGSCLIPEQRPKQTKHCIILQLQNASVADWIASCCSYLARLIADWEKYAFWRGCASKPNEKHVSRTEITKQAKLKQYEAPC